MNLPLPPAALLYPHAVTVWRATEDRDPTSGKFLGLIWATAATGVACYFQQTESQMALQGPVRAEEDNIFTLDILRFAAGTDVRAADVLKMTTGPQVGNFWTVRGDPKRKEQLGRFFTVRGSRLEAAPDGVS